MLQMSEDLFNWVEVRVAARQEILILAIRDSFVGTFTFVAAVIAKNDNLAPG